MEMVRHDQNHLLLEELSNKVFGTKYFMGDERRKTVRTVHNHILGNNVNEGTGAVSIKEVFLIKWKTVMRHPEMKPDINRTGNSPVPILLLTVR